MTVAGGGSSLSPVDQQQQQPGGGGGAQPLSYATRVSPATIQWLVANYETAEGNISNILTIFHLFSICV